MPDHRNMNEHFYDPPLSPHAQAAHHSPTVEGEQEYHTFERVNSYRTQVSDDAVPLHEYPRQDYVMPQWPEDDIYRQGTPASAVGPVSTSPRASME